MSRSRQRLVAATMALSLSAALVSSAAAAPLARRHFTTYSQVTASDLPRQVLEKVIARGGKSKNYSDLIPLDGGTVGIAHFAVGGLAALYREMDTLKYFKRSQLVMIRDFSAKCRPPGKTGNDSGWGCFSQPWWHQGMKSFVLSTQSKSVQNRAWAEMMRPVIAK
ncbi:MAG TPA: hypothetical protein VIJ25_10135, partial [Methylococcales bacterium]